MQRAWVPLALLLLALGSARAAEPQVNLATLLPEEPCPGWKMSGAPRIFDPEHLSDHINGEAEAFLIYNVGDTVTARYEYQGKPRVEVDVYDMRTLRSAFGVYAVRRPAEPELLPLGAEGFATRRATKFFRGRYYVEARALAPLPEAVEATRKIAAAIAARLPGEKRFPPELALLPERGRVPYSEGFSLQAYLNIEQMPPTFVARFRAGKGEAELGIGLAGDEQKARAALGKIIDYARTLGVEQGKLPQGQARQVEVKIKYLGWLRAEIVGQDLVVLTSGEERYPEADALFAEAARRLSAYRRARAG